MSTITHKRESEEAMRANNLCLQIERERKFKCRGYRSPVPMVQVNGRYDDGVVERNVGPVMPILNDDGIAME